jgi:Ulp1 family protease
MESLDMESPERSPDSDDFGDKSCILLMDSLCLHPPTKIASKLRSYLAHEWCDKMKSDERGTQLKPDDPAAVKRTISNLPLAKTNSMPHVPCKSIPRQNNGYDCGVFVIKFVEMLLAVSPSSFSSSISNKSVDVFQSDYFESLISA